MASLARLSLRCLRPGLTPPVSDLLQSRRPSWRPAISGLQVPVQDRKHSTSTSVTLGSGRSSTGSWLSSCRSPVGITSHASCPCLLSRPLSSFFGKKDDNNDKKEGIVQKFKRMTKDYWYVLIPVHLVTSAGWMCGFWLMIKSGVDIPALLEKMGTSTVYIEKVRSSEWANLALAYACYKIATPARYTVTVGGTTLTVKYLHERGYLKTSAQVGQHIKDRTDQVGQQLRDRREHVKDRVEEWERAWKRYARRRPRRKSQSDQ